MRRHEFDPISFVFGMIFAVIGVAFLTGRVDLGDLHLRWLWPIPLIAVGLALLVTTQRREGRSEPTGAVPPPRGEPDQAADAEAAESEPARDTAPADARLDLP